MTEFCSFLKPLIKDFIKYRKASDHWNECTYEENMKLFDRYCYNNYPTATSLTQEMINGWCDQRDTEVNNSCRSRIYVVHCFIKFLQCRQIISAVTTPDLPHVEKRIYIPHAFTEAELNAFFQECDSIKLYHPRSFQEHVRKITLPVFFRLLYSSGIRTNEARQLKKADVDLIHGILNIHYSKGHDQHYIVLHESMLMLMREYQQAISKLYPERTYFFQPVKKRVIQKTGL